MREQLDNVSVKLKANVYFDGGVVSYTVLLGDGTKKTVGVIRPGTFHFNTDAAERMDIVAGSCAVKLAGETDFKTYAAGSFFNVSAKSGFDISVDTGLLEYLCSFS
jgi:uncharacterized protein YaiE (UPF0345 family)